MKQKIRKIKLSEYQLSAPVEKTITFAFLSDLHDCPNNLIVKTLSQLSPDAILVGGDYIHNNEYCQNGFEFLSQASLICPVFCCLGNHEKRYLGDIVKKTEESGAKLLDNSHENFMGVLIGGLSSGHSGDVIKGLMYSSLPNTKWLKEFDGLDGYKILLCHHPEYFMEHIYQTSIPLTLSGHAHGGQWRFFGKGVLAPGQGLFPKYTSGMHHNRLIISRGIGNPRIVPRINNPPEIAIIRLIPSMEK